MSEFKKALCWIRRDLRLHDHTALAEATHRSEAVQVVFIFDELILKKLKDKDDRRLTFIHESLAEVHQGLQKHRSGLLVETGDPVQKIPQIAKRLGAKAVFTNEDYEPYAKQRDQKVAEKLKAQGAQFFSFKDQVIFSGQEVLTQQDTPYRVFTPYRNAWLKKLKPDFFAERKPRPAHFMRSQGSEVSLEKLGFKKASLWLSPGMRAGQKRLKLFQKSMSRYHTDRNFPALAGGTSGLSVHLRFGTLSIRECVRAARESRNSGSQTWLFELVWRDFYQMILDQFPHVVRGSFKEQYNSLKWPGTEAHFKAWCQGRTGYPLVDAAMRHFNETGWMHNRLRMVVASFLTKDLLVDWKKGEAYFARYLLDFDLAANNGGWQWSASTGCDAQPYFRIFHPVSQSKRFDSDGRFIREILPELSELSNRHVHSPWEAKLKVKYPKPIVDHAVQREKALSLFRR